MEQIMKFLLETTLGNILLSVVLTLLLTFICQSFWAFLKKKVKHKQFINFLVRTGTAYVWGRRCQYAKKGTYEQNLVIAQYLHDFLIVISRAMIILLCGISLMLLIPRIYRFLVFPFIGTTLWFQYKKYRNLKTWFDQTIELIFGKEQLESELAGMEQYWDKITMSKSD